MSFTTHQGGEGGVTITGKTYVTVSGTVSGTAAGTTTALCVQNWSATEERKSVSVMTTCDFNTLLKTTYENDTEVSRGLTGEITAFSIDEVQEAPLVESITVGPIFLQKYANNTTSVVEGFNIPLALITSVSHGDAAAGEALHMFKFGFKSKGPFHRGVL